MEASVRFVTARQNKPYKGSLTGRALAAHSARIAELTTASRESGNNETSKKAY